MSDPRALRVQTRRAVRTPTGFREEPSDDRVAAEEPLEVRIEHRGHNTSVAVTMRTPGDDIALAAGFLFTEGIVDAPDDIVEARPCKEEGPDGAIVENVVQVLLRPDHAFDPERFRRNVYTTSSCGICGKASIDAIEVTCLHLGPATRLVEATVLASLPERLRAAQEGFASTGGMHATALVTPAGELLDVREDVGRHNAMDKVIGAAFLDGRLPLGGHLLLVSGRVSFELVQKAARAGVPLVAAIGAPSSLALEAATRLGVTVVGFLAHDRMNVYTHPERVGGWAARQDVLAESDGTT